MDRRSALGSMIGIASINIATPPINEEKDNKILQVLQSFQTAFNTGNSEIFCKQWTAQNFRASSWDKKTNFSRDGYISIDSFFDEIRHKLGKILEQAAAGQYLWQPEDSIIRYFPKFENRNHISKLEIDFITADDGPMKIEEIRIGDISRFSPVATVTVDLPIDGKSDVSSAVQASYDALVARGGGTLQFPPGVFRLSLTLGSRNVQIRGAGRLATQLVPSTPGAVILRAAYRSGTWDAVMICDLTIAGGEAADGIGFRAGNDEPATDDEFIGRTWFKNVRFLNLTTCIDRPRGQIGLTIDGCQFEDADVHLAGEAHQVAGRPLMHGGNILVRGSHFQQARKAVVRIDSTVTGSGQITFLDCIMENNPGIVFDIRNLNANDSVPAVLVSRCWNEQNATAPTISINGKPEKPVYARLINCSLIRFEDTPIGPMTLRNSTVRTLDCSLDQLKHVDQDYESMIAHSRARMFSGAIPPGQVDSVEATYLNTPGRGVSFWIPHRKALSRAYEDALTVSISADCQINFTGTNIVSSGSVADAVLPGAATCQMLRLMPEMQIFPSPVAIAAGRWIAWLYIYRHINGSIPTLSLTGSSGLTLETPLDAREWRTLGGMTFVADDTPSVSFWHRCVGTPATLHIGGMNLLNFKTRQAARDFLNSGLFAI